MPALQTPLILAQSVSDFMFEWYPVFGVVFSLGLLIIFVMLLRSTMGSTKPETVKASHTEPVLWDEVQGVDAAIVLGEIAGFEKCFGHRAVRPRSRRGAVAIDRAPPRRR